MTITIDAAGERVTVCLPPSYDRMVADLLPLYYATGGIDPDDTVETQVRDALRDLLDQGCDDMAATLRDELKDRMRAVMG